MAGHSKWSKVKRFKGALDAKRGKLFSKLSKEIAVSAKLGGGDISANARLRSAVLAARAQNMPGENIERALKRGTGELEGQHYEEIIYEGYAPGGVAIIVEVATDNRNRTAADVRSIFSKHHGNLASSGSVAYMFHRKGQITVSADLVDEERLFGVVLDAGAEEYVHDDGQFTITTPPERLYSVVEALKQAGVEPQSHKLTYVPDTTVFVADEATAAQVVHLCDALDDCDDVQNVHANFEIPEELLSRLAA